jgi:hypothetical protein
MTEPTHLGTYDDTMRLYVRHLDRNLRAVSPSYPIRELSIVAFSSATRPDEFVVLLRAMADELERIAEVEREGRTPFLIDAITANPVDGILTVYYRDND